MHSLKPHSFQNLLPRNFRFVLGLLSGHQHLQICQVVLRGGWVCWQVAGGSKAVTVVHWYGSCGFLIPQNMTYSCVGFLGVFWVGKPCQISWRRIFLKHGLAAGACWACLASTTRALRALLKTQCLFCFRGDLVFASVSALPCHRLWEFSSSPQLFEAFQILGNSPFCWSLDLISGSSFAFCTQRVEVLSCCACLLPARLYCHGWLILISRINYCFPTLGLFGVVCLTSVGGPFDSCAPLPGFIPGLGRWILQH